MLNLLHSIRYSAQRVTYLRKKINELTEELHQEEIKVAMYAAECIGERELELQKEKTL